MWGTVLSDPLPIVALVGRRPANQLMGRMPVPSRVAAFAKRGCPLKAHGGLPGVSTGYPPERGGLHTRYAPVRHSRGPERPLTVRLACIRPAASVHPEPGSNSSLYYCLTLHFFSSGLRCLFLTGRIPLPSRAGNGLLCWPQAFKELRKPSRFPSPPSVVCGCKSTTFPATRKQFF